jgi:hypothetical protein
VVPFARRLLVVLAIATVLAAAPAVVPVRMAWSAPELRLREVPAPAPLRYRVPVASITVSMARAATVPFDASHLGVRWRGDESAPVEVRTAGGGGAWGPWQQVEVAHDLGDEERGEVLTGLVRAGAARRIQARWGSGAREVRLVAIDAEHGPRHLVRAAPASARADVAQPEVVPRGHWGADESMRRAPPSFAPVDRIVVHHTVTPNNDPDPAATMRAMYAYHVKSNGWDDIGYNFVIDAAGHVFEGRWARPYGGGEHPTGESAIGEGVVGAHAEGQNAGSVGVALMGTFTGRSAPTQAALDALQRLLAWKSDRHGLDAAGTVAWAGGSVLPTIAGHNQVGATSCPGDQLTARLPGVRQAVSAVVGAVQNALTPGYWVLARDGRALPFGRAGAAPSLGGLLAPLLAPAAAIAATPSGLGYWVVSDSGRVLPAGDALPLGSPELLGLLQPAGRAAAIEATPSGLGYWVAEESGRVRGFGDAADLGSAPVGPVTAMARTPSGRGYWVATADGRVSAHGDAVHMGSAEGRTRSPVVAIAVARKGRGYWLVTAEGSVFGFGLARRAGGLPELGIRAQVVDAKASASGKGYYLLGSDGAVFTFGDAAFHGAPAGLPPGAAGLALVP